MSAKPSLLPAVFDTSSLIFLDALEYVELLPRLYVPYITPQVIRELQAKPNAAGSGVPASGVLELRSPQTNNLTKLQAEFAAGLGEMASIAVAMELDAWVVLDDKPARLFAQAKGLKLVGTLGVLLRLHRANFHKRTLRDDVDLLQAAGMHLSEKVKRQAFALDR